MSETKMNNHSNFLTFSTKGDGEHSTFCSKVAETNAALDFINGKDSVLNLCVAYTAGVG